MTAACRNDDAFGPTVAGCRGGFDFTQLFEVAILSLLPSLLFIVAGAGCFAAQRRRPSVADPDARLRRPPRAALWSRYAPQLVIGGLVAAKCAYVAGLATAPSLRPRSVTLASGALELVMAALLSPLALLGRRRSRYPSDLVCVYLVVTILLDMARCRTLWLLWQSDRPVFAAAVSFTVSLALKVPLLFLTPRGPSHDTDAKASFPTPPSPDTTAGVISISLFWWINPLVRLGYRQALRLDNLYALSPALAMPGPTADTAGDDGALDAPSTVLGLLVHAAGWSALYPVVPRLLLIACVLAQASLTRRVLGLLAAPDDEADPNSKYGLIGATFLVYLCVALATAWYGYLHERVLTRVRGHLIRRVYGHAARLPAAAATGAAKPSTLATVDVESIYNGLRNAHELWALPIQLAFAVWLAYRELGPASLAALAIIAATCAVVAAVAPVAVARQRVWMAALQARVGQTTAVLEALKTLKMAGFTHRAGALLDAARGDELRRGALFRLVVTVSATLSQVPAVAAPVIVFAASRRRLDAASAFTALGYLNVMTQPLTTAIQVVPLVLASWVCLQRIRDFLATPVHIDTCKRGPIPRGFDDEKPPGRNDGGALAVRIADGSFRWAADREPVLRRVGVDVPKSAVVAVVGPVGCGKSTLLQALLGEVAPDAPGSVAVDAARVAYCAQTPVLADGTIRENIIGPLTLNKVRYDEVMEATALVADMAQLPDGDATRLESRGETLSGGQRQRVALARALYHDPDLLLADDVLASLDPGTQLWVARHVFGPEGLLRRRAATVVLATNFDAAVAMADRRLEIAPSGEVTMSLTPSTPPVPTPAATAPRADEKSDGLDETVHALHPAASAESEPSTHGTTGSGRESPAAKAPKSSDAATWAHYFASVGPWSLALYCVLVVGFGATITYPTLWVEKWTSDTSARHPFGYYMGVYGGLAGACIVANLLMGLVALVLFVHRAGTALHRGALRAVLGATMRHLLRTSVGAMLTHFSQDLGIIDGMLAGTLINLSATAAVAAGQAVLIALASPWLAIGYPLVGAALYLLARAYVPTALRLRVLDLEAKGPLVAHLLATAAALATTRAFGRAGSEAARHRRLLGRAQRPSYFLGMAQQWLVLVNNLVVAALATGLVALSTALRTDAAAVGVGLVSLIGLGRVLADMVRAYTMVETALGAVARLAALVRETPQERRGTVTPAESWPATGRLRMTNVSAGYGDGADSGPLALRDVTLSVAPGEKVAIFGRTGSGKSSLLLALLGMLEPQPEGAESIAVDDVPTHQIDGELLRERLIAMPQHAVFLPDGASVRDNLDALGDAPSEACHDALERVGLRAALADLDSVLEPQTLSDGQRQLFSLARCIVRRRARRARGGPEGGLLLLDEIAAHVDAGTAAQMDAIVQAEFGHFTVLAVTHRMPSPGTFQRALVMADGRVVEDGPMEPLLRDQQSRLAALFSAL